MRSAATSAGAGRPARNQYREIGPLKSGTDQRREAGWPRFRVGRKCCQRRIPSTQFRLEHRHGAVGEQIPPFADLLVGQAAILAQRNDAERREHEAGQDDRQREQHQRESERRIRAVRPP